MEINWHKLELNINVDSLAINKDDYTASSELSSPASEHNKNSDGAPKKYKLKMPNEMPQEEARLDKNSHRDNVAAQQNNLVDKIDKLSVKDNTHQKG